MVALKAALGARQGDKHTVVLALALETALVAGSRVARWCKGVVYTAWKPCVSVAGSIWA